MFCSGCGKQVLDDADVCWVWGRRPGIREKDHEGPWITAGLLLILSCLQLFGGWESFGRRQDAGAPRPGPVLTEPSYDSAAVDFATAGGDGAP
jgi:hypothetical protein